MRKNDFFLGYMSAAPRLSAAVLLGVLLGTAVAGQAADAGKDKAASAKLEMFVMSQCPYGVQVENAIAPVKQQLGDKLEVQIAKVDTFKRQVDFQLAGTTDDRARSEVRPERPAQKPRPEKEARFVPPRPGTPAKGEQGRRWHGPRRGGGRRQPHRGGSR